MPLNPIDDIKTYRTVADAVYSRKATGINPDAVNKRRENAAGLAADAQPLSNAPAASIPGVKFTKGFTPAERAKQAAMLKAKLATQESQDE